METFKVEVPDEKKALFIEFLRLIGVEFSTKKNNYVAEEKSEYLNESQKKILDERLSADETEFIDAKEALTKIREKYGI